MQHHSSRVIPLDSGNRRARRQVDALLAEAEEYLAAARAGQLVHTHGAHLALVRAVAIVLEHRLDAEEVAC